MVQIANQTIPSCGDRYLGSVAPADPVDYLIGFCVPLCYWTCTRHAYICLTIALAAGLGGGDTYLLVMSLAFWDQ